MVCEQIKLLNPELARKSPTVVKEFLLSLGDEMLVRHTCTKVWRKVCTIVEVIINYAHACNDVLLFIQADPPMWYVVFAS